jgi:hypothetical protein
MRPAATTGRDTMAAVSSTDHCLRGATVDAIYEKPGYLVISHNRAKNYILFDWTNFNVTLDEIKSAHTKALETARRTGCRTYIADTSKVANTLRQEVIDWWGSTWVPELSNFGLRSIVTVVPERALAKLSTNTWQRQVVAGIAMTNVASIAEAESQV